ncbi:MAG: hypothetical protein KAQ98_09500 [Bacteriovoracaceae bacterium]|nr:hypothetical protein [Bacteriovoracaceae bacterium]
MKVSKIFITALMVFTLLHVQMVTTPLGLINVSPVNAAYAGMETEKLDKASSGGAGIMEFITSVAVGVVAASMIRCRGKTLDTYAAAVGGTAYVIGEIMSFFKFKEAQSRIITYERDENGVIVDADKTALEEQRKNYNEVVAGLESKLKFQKAASVAFLSAAGLATAGHLIVTGSKMACASGLKTTAAFCKTGVVTCKTASGICLKAISCSVDCAPAIAACQAAMESCRMTVGLETGAGLPLTVYTSCPTGCALASIQLGLCSAAAVSAMGVALPNLTALDKAVTFSDVNADTIALTSNIMMTSLYNACGQSIADTAKIVASRAKDLSKEGAGSVAKQGGSGMMKMIAAGALGFGLLGMVGGSKENKEQTSEMRKADTHGTSGFKSDSGEKVKPKTEYQRKVLEEGIQDNSGDKSNEDEYEYEYDIEVEDSQSSIFDFILPKVYAAAATDASYTAKDKAKAAALYAKLAASGKATSYKLICAAKGRLSCQFYYDRVRKALNRCTNLQIPTASSTVVKKHPIEKQIDDYWKMRGEHEKFMMVKKELAPMFGGLVAPDYNENEAIEGVLADTGIRRFDIVVDHGEVNNVDEYVSAHEKMALMNGRIESMGADEYFALKDAYETEGGREMQTGMSGILKVAARKGFDLLVPGAHAFGGGKIGQLLGLGVVALVLYYATKATQTVFIDTYMATYSKRAIIFGIISTLIIIASRTTQRNIEKVKEQIKKIDAILAQIGERQGTGKDYDGDYTGQDYSSTEVSVKAHAPGYSEVKVKRGGGESSGIELDAQTPCITENCSSVTGEMSNVSDKQMIAGMSSVGKGSDILNDVKAVGSVGNKIQGRKKLSAATMQSVSGLGKKHAVLSKKLRNLQKLLNRKFKQVGEKPIDFESLHDNAIKQLKANTVKALADKGYNAGSAGKAFKLNIKARKKELAKWNKQMKQRRSKSAVVSSKKKSSKGFFDDEENKQAEPSEPVDDTNYDQGEQLAKYEDSASEIVKDDSVSIFDVISARYIRSALQKLFKKKKVKKKVRNKDK